MNEETILNDFKNMLIREGKSIETPSGNKSTVEDYQYRIKSICKNEQITLSYLFDNIDDYVEKYSPGGVNEKEGSKSHNSVINALKALRRLKVYNGRILFCKIGWANNYEGNFKDRPQGGGKYTQDNIGHETLNFKADNGIVYGYFQAARKGKHSQTNLERIDAEFVRKDSIEDTLVVWVSNNPNEHKIQIVGWYKNATVYRYPQKTKQESERYKYFYNLDFNKEGDKKYVDTWPVYRVSAKEKNIVLLPINKRNFDIRYVDGIGKQSSTWFAENSQHFVDKVIEYICDYQHESIIAEEKINSSIILEGKEREQLIKLRINQSDFRKLMINKYNKCCLCGVDSKELLIASHIKPWSKSTSFEKVDENNGLFLCPNHDYLFDKGFISFNDDGTIIISELLNSNNKIFLNINADMKINVNENMLKYLDYHRNNILKKLDNR